MELSLFYFVFILLVLLSAADPTEVDSQCPTSRRLLLFGGSDVAKGEKKSPRISSPAKTSPAPSSPPKYARSSESSDLIVYIRPEGSPERPHKGRSYTHLLKPKSHPEREKRKAKRPTSEHKKPLKKQKKKKNSTPHKSSPTTKSQELVAIDEDELSRCRALLHIETPDKIEETKEKKDKKVKPAEPSNIKNTTEQVAKEIKKKVVPEPITPAAQEKKAKSTKTTVEVRPEEKKPAKVSNTKSTEKRSSIPTIEDVPIKTPTSQPTTNVKSKRDKPQAPPPVVQDEPTLFDTHDDETENQTNSVVNRALHFVKNMFQLSDDSLSDEHTSENHVLDLAQEQQQQHHHHHSRKLLSVDESNIVLPSIADNQTNAHGLNSYFTDERPIDTTDADDDDWSHLAASVSKRQLLAVKTNKRTATPKASDSKGKKAKSTKTPDAAKPKVGWAYRYRISRYLNAQKMKRTGKRSKASGRGEEKSKDSKQQSNSKQIQKKTSSKTDAKVAKRKLLAYHDAEDSSEWQKNDISHADTLDSVLTTEHFIPKRQLLAAKAKRKDEQATTDDDHDRQQSSTRRQMKSFEELTDPVAIVKSYDRGLFKPRVGWQFRYRVSRYIDSLRANIREDQQRLKLGLQAIKRNTPQELSGRRKRVLDKPFAPDAEQLKKQQETTAAAQENKPHVGWTYRYRISKMNEAKRRGDYVDDQEEKRKARREQNKKQASPNKSRDAAHRSIEGEKELDSELRQISDEGRRVGWAYRYRVRRKLDDLKRQQAETGRSFDLVNLGGKREKKVADSKSKPTETKTTEPAEQKPEEKKKSAGWEYRYRISKMREAQKQNKSKGSKSKPAEKVPAHEKLDPQLARLTPEQRAVGWNYRYRIRKKLDSTKEAPSDERQSGKRSKQPSSKRKHKEKIIKKVEESIEKILNIDDIDETPFMEYFRRGSSYVLHGLVPAAKKSICLLPLPGTFSFCKEDEHAPVAPIRTQTKKSRKASKKRLKTKKEQRAKQFIHAPVTKLGADDKATERRVDETMRKLYKKPSLPPPQTPPRPSSSTDEKTPKKHRARLPKRSQGEEPKKRSADDELAGKTKIGVDSKKSKNKKQFQIIGKEVKVKNKHISPPLVDTTTTTTTTTTTAATAPVPETTTPTTAAPPRLRTIAEVIQEDALNILGTNRKSSRTPEEFKAEVEEANEIVVERAKADEKTTTQATVTESATVNDDAEDSAATDEEEKTSGEKITESVYDVLELEKNKDSS